MENFTDSFFEKVASKADREKEVQLIAKAQTGDALAFKHLRRLFDGAIRMAINRSGIKHTDIQEDAIMAAAMKEFKRSIMTYDVSHASSANPATFIIGNIKKDLQKIKNADQNETRLTDKDANIANNMYLANQDMMQQLDRQPSTTEILEYINKDRPNPYSARDIDRVKQKERQELSMNEIIGQSGVGEDVSYGDIYNTGKLSVADSLEQIQQKEQLDNALSTLPLDERDFIEEFKGLGKYEKTGPKRHMAMANSRGMSSEYEVQKKYREIEAKLKSALGVF